MKHIPKINIEIIPHNKQRYNTAGDYFLDNRGIWQFRISEMKNIYYEMFVLIHELWEWLRVVIVKGIPEPIIAQFDKDHIEHPDPGTLKNAPYHKEHMESTSIEKFLIKKVKLNWKTYDKSFDKLKYD